MRTLPLILLLLVACGQSDEPGPELLWLPDYSTPEKATETYMRAIETGDLDLAVTATVPEQREAHYRSIGALLAAARDHGVRFKVEPVDGTAHSNESAAWVDVRLSAVDESGNPGEFIPPGEKEPRSVGSSIFAFELQPDRSWRYSPALVGKIANERRAKAQSESPAQPD